MDFFQDNTSTQVYGDTAKKRKVDADGFLMPSSPHKFTSPHKVISPQSSFTLGISDLESVKENTGDSVFSPRKLEFESNGHDTNPIQDKTNITHVPSGKGAASQDTDVQSQMRSILEELKAEHATVYKDWSKNLLDTEDYENNCVQKLDDMIIEAKKIEENINNRKETLRQRLSEILNVLK
ncbi:hypothetical protein ACF0H5_013543 [Mactra antiquata]